MVAYDLYIYTKIVGWLVAYELFIYTKVVGWLDVCELCIHTKILGLISLLWTVYLHEDCRIDDRLSTFLVFLNHFTYSNHCSSYIKVADHHLICNIIMS